MNIRIIEAKPKPTRFRVAAYARVSTKKEQQEESYETQKAYYQNGNLLYGLSQRLMKMSLFQE